MVSGCLIIPVPAPEAEPYDPNFLAKLEKEQASREEVVEAMGEPNLARETDSIWIYGKSRRLSYFAGVSVTGAGAGTIEDFQFVVVEFQNDSVKHIELVEDREGCSASGICLSNAWRNIEAEHFEQQLSPEYTIVASVRDDDKQSKQFEPVIDRCSLYYYQDNVFATPIRIGANLSIQVSNDTYAHLILEPGVYELSKESSRIRNTLGFTESLTCDAGSVLFRKRNQSVGKIFGKKEISERRLILLP
jgi:hypothetical protein